MTNGEIDNKIERIIVEKCSSPGCTNNGKLQCPTCISLKLSTPSVFCSQECFKTYWPLHKLYHNSKDLQQQQQQSQQGNALPSNFIGYKFTGTLRPYEVVKPMRKVPNEIGKPDYAIGSVPISERALIGKSRPIIEHTEEEIEIVRQLGKMGREVLDIAANAAKVGVTTEEIDLIVHNACIERNAYPSPLNYYGFPKACCTSPNEVICHGIPDKRPLKDGDILNIDVSLYWKGFHTDLNETYLIGNVDEKGKQLVQTAYECLEKAIEICKPGVLYRELGNVIQKHANKNGFSVVKNFVGHGVGRLYHGAPDVPHYSKNKAIGTMKIGHIFTIEPMINEGSWREEFWPDEWTAVTVDGKRSAQFEHTLLITPTGVEVLTKRTKGTYIDRHF